MAKLKLIAGDKERLVTEVEIQFVNGYAGTISVNNGKDDLYDLGFKPFELISHGLKIVPVDETKKFGE